MTNEESMAANATGGPDPITEGSTRVHAWQLHGASQRAYEENLVPAIFASCADQLLDATQLVPDDRVLDVACGTGIVARRAAARVGDRGTVAGSDMNVGMIEVARAAAAGRHLDIDWRVADVTALPYGSGSFTVVCCQQGLQFFGDQQAALAEMRRVLTPDGRIGVAIWRPLEFSPGFGMLIDAVERNVGPAAAAVMRAPFSAPGREALRTLIASAGFRDPWIGIGMVTVRFPSAADFLRLQAASSPLGAHLDGLEPSRVQGLLDDLGAGFDASSCDDGIVFPLQTWLIRATRR